MLQLPLNSISALCFNLNKDGQSANGFTSIDKIFTFNNNYLSAFLVYRELSDSYINASIYLVDWSTLAILDEVYFDEQKHYIGVYLLTGYDKEFDRGVYLDVGTKDAYIRFKIINTLNDSFRLNKCYTRIKKHY